MQQTLLLLASSNYGHLDYLTAYVQTVHGKRYENYNIYFEFSHIFMSRIFSRPE